MNSVFHAFKSMELGIIYIMPFILAFISHFMHLDSIKVHLCFIYELTYFDLNNGHLGSQVLYWGLLKHS